MKNSLSRIFFLLFFLTFSVSAQTEREKGIESYRNGNYQSAIESLKVVTEVNKTDAEAWNVLGMSYLGVLSYKESRKALENAVRQNPQKAEFYLNLAYANLLSNRLAQAERDIKKAIALDAKNATAFYVQGLISLWNAKFDNAIAEAQQSLSLDKSMQVTYLLKANAYLYKFGQSFEKDSSKAETLGNLQKAIETLEACLSNCAPDPNLASNQTRLEELKVFYKYFSTRKTFDIDKTVSIPNTDPTITPLSILTKPRVKYTESARLAGVSGEIALAVLFSADGKSKMIIVLKPLSNGLTEEAIKAAQAITFNPKMKDGKPVSVVKIVKYQFSLF